jgi:ribonuclease G
MAKEICISSTPHETRLAILEDDQLAEIYYERENEYTLAGSIYNGKVTRVLPGMQSAFVDIGLERDAFLYVTDFMELDDSEETDELEKAAASGAATPPREVRPQGGRPEERPEPRQESRQEQRQEPRPERAEGGRGRRDRDRGDRQPREPRVEVVPQPEVQETEYVAEESLAVAEAPQAETSEQQPPMGGRRWRGRRGRRGRGERQTGTAEPQSEEESVEELVLEPAEEETASDIHAAAVAEPEVEELEETLAEVPVRQEPRTPRAYEPRSSEAAPRSSEPVAFVLPGESLSKYGGGAPVDAAPKPVTPLRPASMAKPSTMIELPLEWDGSGLLPGESLSLRKRRTPEPETETPAEAGVEAAAQPVVEPVAQPAMAQEVEFVEEIEEAEGSAVVEEESLTVVKSAISDQAEEELVEELEEDEFDEDEFEEEELEEEELVEEEEQHAPAAPVVEEAKTGEAEPAEGSASHNVDPATPSGFRLFGFGKKKEEKSTVKDTAAQVKQVSTYAPGAGRVEEEVIDGEEYVAPSRGRRNKPVPAELDDFEEQTLAGRKGGKNALSIQISEDDDEDEDEAEASGQPRRTERTDRADRGARGRRGRGQQPVPQGNNRRGPSRRSMQTTDLPVISDLLKPGQEILVQIAKEPIAKKGARITSHIALPGRFLVFMPTVSHVGVSRKIASDEERHRLKKILVHERGESSGGFIVRTAAEGASEEELRADLRFLMNLWNDIKQRSDTQKSPALIYHDLSLIERILRDQVSSNFSNIWVDSEANYERIVRFLNRFSPTLVRRVKLYTKETPMFEHFGIEDEISKALRSKVWLKSGGSIVINQTEALVAIDINTGKYVGKSARLEDTIVKTNLDAVPEIVRQIRLRDLGGIIVIDFIDMDERKNRFKVLAALEEALKNDRAPTKVLQFNDFGLVAITRKRVKQSLERTLSVPCPTCQATGMVKSPVTVANEIYVELRKMKKHFEGADILLRVHPETVKVLKGNNAAWLTEFEELTGKNILVKSDATLHPEQFDVQG